MADPYKGDPQEPHDIDLHQPGDTGCPIAETTSRPIKFRAKALDGRGWVYGYYLEMFDAACIVTLIEPICYPDNFIEVDPKTRGEWTGLHETEGTKRSVYEGDYIIFDDSEIGGQRVKGEVLFNTDQSLGPIGWGLETCRGYRNTDFLGHITIIGNRFDDAPDLLKERI